MPALTRRTAALIGAATLVATAAVVAGFLLASPRAVPTPAATSGGAGPRVAAPEPPASGAYLGAWVQPPVYTQPGRVAAVGAFQREIGRPLDIVHTYLRWADPWPTRSDLAFLRGGSMLLLSWAGTDTRAIESGVYDRLIRQRAEAVKATGKPIFLEWRWEMDRPGLRSQVHSAADYVAAWRHIHAIFTAEHVRNIAWVWCPMADGFPSGRAGAYYPGDGQVDWVCADAYPGFGPYQPFAGTVRAFLAWASHHPKPVMIGEYGDPQSYGPRRAQWLGGVAQTVRGDPQIKALVYFDANPPAPGPPQISFALDRNSAALQAFREIAQDPYFNPRGLPVSDP